jgi:primosomal protein N' (replication factor Y)
MSDNSFVCHYCGYRTKKITKCPACGEAALIGIGVGIEKVLKEVEQIFIESRILSLSSDNMNTPNKISEAIRKITDHEVDIIIGTQIVAKGHNFMNLNTIIVTCIDSMLYGEDFRATEKTFQIIHQVAGRAGRSDQSSKNSVVVVQTYNPDDKLISLLTLNNSEEFYNLELCNRKLTGMPPFGRVISIVLSSYDKDKLKSFAQILVKCKIYNKDIKVLGPITPSIHKLRNSYRLKFIILSKNLAQEYISKWLKSVKIPKDIKILIDVDPYDFV